ncbi:hypothetical protein HPP92_015001 [Vanilla planifolia]|uniref:Uncharacterized protein n=1 Tax=Vanilla planifolia TaxID=51239 RepID=A0A835UWT0_VANPL|nr:hypothetical protein HPP92_015001 [Vanilla planifolia]
MVFSSFPIYQDSPNSWNQQRAQLLQLPQLAEPPPQPTGPTNSARPVSMAERARLAKIPPPDLARIKPALRLQQHQVLLLQQLLPPNRATSARPAAATGRTAAPSATSPSAEDAVAISAAKPLTRHLNRCSALRQNRLACPPFGKPPPT